MIKKYSATGFINQDFVSEKLCPSSLTQAVNAWVSWERAVLLVRAGGSAPGPRMCQEVVLGEP